MVYIHTPYLYIEIIAYIERDYSLGSGSGAPNSLSRLMIIFESSLNPNSEKVSTSSNCKLALTRHRDVRIFSKIHILTMYA